MTLREIYSFLYETCGQDIALEYGLRALNKLGKNWQEIDHADVAALLAEKNKAQ